MTRLEQHRNTARQAAADAAEAAEHAWCAAKAWTAAERAAEAQDA